MCLNAKQECVMETLIHDSDKTVSPELPEAAGKPEQPAVQLVLIPCLSGAPWSHEQRKAFAPYETRTLRLNELVREIERHVDDVLEAASGLGPFVLVGDSFGAQVALACAARHPSHLVGIVMSGGFAANPVDDLITKVKVIAARLMPGPLYRRFVIPMHAQLLASPFDKEGEVNWNEERSQALFRANTSWTGYINRTRASLSADYRSVLGTIDIPVLIITPEDDRLIGKTAAGIMLDGLPQAEEVVLARTGHMLRFTHPARYAATVQAFLRSQIEPRLRGLRRSDGVA
jgi:pimeloyl-ACP methyl ester carboxylesterase